MASGFKSGRSGLRLHAVVRGLLRRIDALSGKNGAAASAAGKSPAQRRIRGHVDVADLDGVVGWAFDTTDPSRRCEVEVVSNDGTIIAQGRADQQRDDLKRAGYADGEHGFRIKIPFEKSTMYASAVIRESQTQATLGTYTLPRFVAALDPASFDPESTHVTGWCIDRQNSKLRPKLVGVSGGREFPIGAASLYRPDLLTAGLGDGFSGFEFPKRVLHGMDTFSIVDARTDTAVVKDAQLDSGLGGKEAG